MTMTSEPQMPRPGGLRGGGCCWANWRRRGAEERSTRSSRLYRLAVGCQGSSTSPVAVALSRKEARGRRRSGPQQHLVHGAIRVETLLKDSSSRVFVRWSTLLWTTRKFVDRRRRTASRRSSKPTPRRTTPRSGRRSVRIYLHWIKTGSTTPPSVPRNHSWSWARTTKSTCLLMIITTPRTVLAWIVMTMTISPYRRTRLIGGH